MVRQILCKTNAQKYGKMLHSAASGAKAREVWEEATLFQKILSSRKGLAAKAQNNLDGLKIIVLIIRPEMR